MKIGELSDRTGLAVSAIRFYEERGLLPQAARGANGYRLYAEDSVKRLKMVSAGQKLGFSLETIRGLFPDGGGCSIERTLTELDSRLKEVELLQVSLETQRLDILALRASLADSLATGQPHACDQPHAQ